MTNDWKTLHLFIQKYAPGNKAGTSQSSRTARNRQKAIIYAYTPEQNYVNDWKIIRDRNAKPNYSIQGRIYETEWSEYLSKPIILFRNTVPLKNKSCSVKYGHELMVMKSNWRKSPSLLITNPRFVSLYTHKYGFCFYIPIATCLLICNHSASRRFLNGINPQGQVAPYFLEIISMSNTFIKIYFHESRNKPIA